LIERGYSNTYIVADYPDNNKSDEDWNIYWERKSNELMLHSDLNLFVFFANCSNEGVTDELAHFCSERREFSGCRAGSMRDRERCTMRMEVDG